MDKQVDAGTIEFHGEVYKVWWDPRDLTVWVEDKMGARTHYNQAKCRSVDDAGKMAAEMLRSAGY